MKRLLLGLALLLSAAVSHAQMAGGVMASGRVNLASPGPIGGTTPAAITGTTIKANTAYTTGASVPLTIQYGATTNDVFTVAATTGTLTLTTNATGLKWQLVNDASLRLASDGYLGFNSGTTLGAGSLDTFLLRDAANTLAARNGTNPQAFRVYREYTDGSNNAYVGFATGAGFATLLTTAAGSSSGLSFTVGTSGAQALNFRTSATDRWSVASGGDLTALTGGLSVKSPRFTATGGTAPTCTSNCGTSPSVSGNDSGFTVTMGATGVPASGWVITFNNTWTNAPACTVQMALTGMAVGKQALTAVTTTTTLTVVTNGTAPATSDKYHAICIGT